MLNIVVKFNIFFFCCYCGVVESQFYCWNITCFFFLNRNYYLRCFWVGYFKVKVWFFYISYMFLDKITYKMLPICVSYCNYFRVNVLIYWKSSYCVFNWFLKLNIFTSLFSAILAVNMLSSFTSSSLWNMCWFRFKIFVLCYLCDQASLLSCYLYEMPGL